MLNSSVSSAGSLVGLTCRQCGGAGEIRYLPSGCYDIEVEECGDCHGTGYVGPHGNDCSVCGAASVASDSSVQGAAGAVE